MSTVRVHLAEVPTDVLVYLSAHPSRLFTVSVLADMLAPLGTVGPEASVGAALRLLREAGYVYKNGDHAWGITTAGLLAVRDASLTGGSDPIPTEATETNAKSCACGERTNEGQHAEAVCTVGSAVYLRPEGTDA